MLQLKDWHEFNNKIPTKGWLKLNIILEYSQIWLLIIKVKTLIYRSIILNNHLKLGKIYNLVKIKWIVWLINYKKSNNWNLKKIILN